ncbi:MAG: dihydropteroate synthase [Thermoplasmatales archaeon]
MPSSQQWSDEIYFRFNARSVSKEYNIPLSELTDFQVFLVTSKPLDTGGKTWTFGRHKIYPMMFREINDLIKDMNYPVKENYWKLTSPVRIRGRTGLINFPTVMVIMNMTPDSFYPGSRVKEEEVNEKLDEIEKFGGNLVDIGGQSTRPGSEEISSQEELRRISKAVEISLNRKFIVSVDSYRPEILRECLEMGAHIINDVTGYESKEVGKLAKSYDVPLIVMHKKGDFKTMQDSPYYENVINEISQFFLNKIVEARTVGIEDNLILDPGIGFGKRLEDNLSIIENLQDLKLGHPLLIGLSRKSFIGKLLNEKVEQREISSLIFNSIAIMNGADIVRVHDIKENFKLIKIIKKLKEF